MPKLLFFLPCERVIRSQEGLLSFITIIHEMTINIPPDKEANLPANAVVPISWNAVSVWERDESDGERQFEQQVRFILPNGNIPTDVIMPISFQERVNRRQIIISVDGFPVSPEGRANLILLLREIGGNNEFQEIACYPIYIKRTNEPKE